MLQTAMPHGSVRGHHAGRGLQPDLLARDMPQAIALAMTGGVTGLDFHRDPAGTRPAIPIALILHGPHLRFMQREDRAATTVFYYSIQAKQAA
ncbi:hypothetical protein GCM10025771_35060 [Niveibacterium umoris]